MKTYQPAIAIAAATVLLSTLNSRAEEQVAKSQLQGRWKVISAESNGGNYLAPSIDKMFVTVDKDEIRFEIEGTDSIQAARFALHPDKNPTEIDFVRATQDHAWNDDNAVTKLFRGWKIVNGKAVPNDEKVEGIYKLDQDRLTLCWRGMKGKEILPAGVSRDSYIRPTVFRSDLYYHQFLFELERIK